MLHAAGHKGDGPPRPSRRRMSYKGKRILAIVPARGGVQRIPRKNLAPLRGKPLIYYAIRNGQQCPYVTTTVVSTEDSEIARVAEELGSLVIPRPARLSQPETKTEPVLVHNVNVLKEQGEAYDAVLLLQPTTPFRKTATLSKTIEIFFEKNADSVVTVAPVPAKFNPYKGGTIEDGLLRPFSSKSGMIRRDQDAPVLYMRNGQVYVSKTSLIEQGRLFGERCVPYVMDEEFIVNIDDYSDLALAEFLVDKDYLQLEE